MQPQLRSLLRFLTRRNPQRPDRALLVVSGIALCACFAAIGCDRDPMFRVYDAPKEPGYDVQIPEVKRFLIAIVPDGDSAVFIKASDKPERLDSFSENLRQIAAELVRKESGELKWSLPENWKVLPGNQIASAILEAPAEGKPIQFVVTELPIRQDWELYLESNINRWRTQLGLPETTFAEQKSELVEVPRQGQERSAILLDLTGAGSTASMGMSSTAPARPMPQVSSPSSAPPSAPSVEYEMPEGWTDVGPSGLRVASFVLDGKKEYGEVSVIFASGDRVANVERWQGQLTPEAAPEKISELAAAAMKNATPVKSANEVNGELFSLLGPEGEEQPAMLVASLPVGDGGSSLFVKLTSNATRAAAHREKLIAFISSLKW